MAANERAALTDPRIAYDPFNNRFIVCMQTVTGSAGKLLIGVSQTSDPAGIWNLYNFNSAHTVDFPILRIQQELDLAEHQSVQQRRHGLPE